MVLVSSSCWLSLIRLVAVLALCYVADAQPLPVSYGPWSSLRGAHYPGYSAPGRNGQYLGYTVYAGGAVNTSVVIGSNGVALVISQTGHVVAWNVTTGFNLQLLSFVESNVGLNSPALGPSGNVFLPENMGAGIAVFENSGVPIWETATFVNTVQGPSRVSPTMGCSNTVLWAGLDSTIRAFEVSNGIQLWSLQVPWNSPFVSTPVVDGNCNVFVGGTTGAFVVVNGLTGHLFAIFNTSSPITASPVIANNGNVFVVTTGGYAMAIPAPHFNKTAWTIGLWGSTPVGDPTIYLDILIVATSTDLIGLNTSTGAQLWSFAVPAHISNSPVVRTDGIAFVPTFNNTVYAVSCSTGLLIRVYQLGFPEYAAAIPAIAGDGTLVVGSEDGHVYRFCVDWSCWGCDNNHYGYWCENFIPCSIGHGSCGFGCMDPTGNGQCTQCYPGWEPPSCMSTTCNVSSTSYLPSQAVLGPAAVAPNGNVYTILAATNIVICTSSTLGWIWTIPGIPYPSYPVLGSAGHLFVRSSNTLYCMSQLSGAVLWSYPLVAEVAGPGVVGPAVATSPNGIVYVADYANVYAINQTSNATIWRYQRSNSGSHTAVLYQGFGSSGVVFFGAGTNWFVLNSTTGVQKSSSSLGSAIVSTPVGNSAGLVAIAASHPFLMIIDALAGTGLLAVGIPIVTPPLMTPTTLYYAYTQFLTGQGSISASNITIPVHSTSLWTYYIVDNDVVTSALVMDQQGILYFSTKFGFLYALNSTNGMFLWRHLIDSSGTSLGGPTIGPSGTVYQTGDGLYTFAPETYCTACAPGFFGSRCANQITCNTANGNCITAGCWGPTGNGQCDTCNQGFMLPNCVSCVSGNFGPSCLPVTCNTTFGVCAFGTCSGISGTGHCDACDSVHYGPDCQYHIRCNTTRGYCASSTVCSGPYGQGNCDFCFSPFGEVDCNGCDDGHFGPDCAPPLCDTLHGGCPPLTCAGAEGNGQCAYCIGNWSLPLCSDCDSLHFGAECELETACSPMSGSCPAGLCYGTQGDGECRGCLQGWAAPNCSTPVCEVNYTWIQSFVGGGYSAINSDGSQLYSFYAGLLYVVNASSGDLIYSIDLHQDPGFSNPTFANGLLFIPANGFLNVFNTVTTFGQYGYLMANADGFNSTVVVSWRGIVVFVDGVQVAALNVTTGNLMWSHATFYFASRTGVALWDAGHAVVFGVDTQLFSYDLNGTLLWSLYSLQTFVTTPLIDENGFVYIGDGSGNFKAYSSGGQLLWSTEIGAGFSFPAVIVEHTVLIPVELNSQACFATLNRTNGDQISNDCFGLQTAFNSGPVVSGSGVLYFLMDGFVYALNATTRGLFWRHPIHESLVISKVPLLLDGNGNLYIAAVVASSFAADYNCVYCDSGYFGLTCSNPISCVLDHGFCLDGLCYGPSGDGHCNQCSSDWGGPDCNDDCVTGFGVNCTAVTCSLSTGICDYGCFGRNGTGHCSACAAGNWGEDCQSETLCGFGTCTVGNCSGLYGNGQCDSCIPGFQMPYCMDCVANRFGNPHCDMPVFCNISNGACTEGTCSGVDGNGECTSCYGNWVGMACNDCFLYYFGPGCASHIGCDLTNGNCSQNCTGPLGNGHCTYCLNDLVWGPDCNLPTPASCDTCESGPGLCAGHQGTGICSTCNATLWGPGCDSLVMCVHGQCPVGLCSGPLGNGSCVGPCDTGFRGPDCSVAWSSSSSSAAGHSSSVPSSTLPISSSTIPSSSGHSSSSPHRSSSHASSSLSVQSSTFSSTAGSSSVLSSTMPSSSSIRYSSSQPHSSSTASTSSSSFSSTASSTYPSSSSLSFSSSLSPSSSLSSSWSSSSTAAGLPPALRVISCTLDSTAIVITVVFSESTNVFGPSPPRLHSAFSCSLVISSPAALGTEPSCQWSMANTLMVVLSPDAVLVPGESLLFMSYNSLGTSSVAGITSSDGSIWFTGGPVVVNPLQSPPTPVVSITAPQSVPLCAPVALDATLSTGLTRMSVLVWSVIGVDSSDPYLVDTAQLNDQLQAANELPPLQGLYLQLNSTALVPSVSYTLRLSITNIFSMTGAAWVTIFKSDVNTPSLTIVAPAAVVPSTATSLQAVLTFECAAAQGPYSFQWTQTNGPSLNLASASTVKSTLVLPSFALQSGFTYGMAVAVSPVGNLDSAFSLRADVAVSVEASPIVAVISPSSNGLICACSPLALSAAASFDPDQAPGQRSLSAFSFNWTCVAFKSSAGSCSFMSLVDSFSPELVVPANTLDSNQTYQFSVLVTDGSRESMTSVLYSTTNVSMLNVVIQQAGAAATDGTVSSTNAVRLSATVFAPGSSSAIPASQIGSYSWSQASSDQVLLNLEDPAIVLTSANSPYLTLAAGSLVPGLTYTLQLAVTSISGVAGFGEIELNVLSAPYSLVSPSLSVVPSQGLVALATVSTISALGFVDPSGGSLQFSFSALDVDTLVVYQLSSVIASSRISTLLPSGRLNVSAIVYSTSGAQAASSIIQVIVAPLTSTDQAVLAVCQVFNITVTTLQATVWAQDGSGAVSLIALLSSALNSTATQQDPSFMCPGVGLNVSAVNAILTTTLTSLLNLEAQGLLDSGTIDANSGVAVSQITSSLSLLTANGSLSNSSVAAAISTINSVAGIVSAISGSSTNANVTSIVSTTVNVVGNVLTAGSVRCDPQLADCSAADPCADFGSLSTALQQILVSSTQNANPSEPPLSVSSSQGTVNASVVPTTSSNSQTLGPASVPDLSAATNFSSGQLSVIQFSSSVGLCLPSNGSLDVNSTIVSIVVTNGSSAAISVNGLPSSAPVSISFGQGATCNQVCGWYNPSSLSWSTEGCSISSALSTGNLTVCQCTHLTEFALLLDALETGCNVFSSTMIVEFHVFAALFAALFAIATVQMIRGILVRVRTKCQCSLMHFEHAVVMAVSAIRFCLSLYRSEYLAYHSFSVDQLVIEELLVAAGFCLTFIGSSYMVASWASLVHFSMDRANPFDGLRKIFSMAIFLQIAVVIALLISLPVAAISSSVGVATYIAQAGAAIMGIVAIVFCCLFFRYGMGLNTILQGASGAMVDKGTCTPGRRILSAGLAFALAYFGEALVWLISVFDTSASAEVVYGLLDGFNVAGLACLLLVFASGTSRASKPKASDHSHSSIASHSAARTHQSGALSVHSSYSASSPDASSHTVELQASPSSGTRNSKGPPPVPQNIARSGKPSGSIASGQQVSADNSPFYE